MFDAVDSTGFKPVAAIIYRISVCVSLCVCTNADDVKHELSLDKCQKESSVS